MPSEKLPDFFPRLTQQSGTLLTTRTLAVEGLHGLASAAAALDLQRSTGRTLLVVCEDEDPARRFADNLSFLLGDDADSVDFLGERQVALLLHDTWSPYHRGRILPDRRARRERLSTLYQLGQPFRPRFVVATAQALWRKLPPRDLFDKRSQYLISGVDIDRNALLRSLNELGYDNVPLVEDPGTYGVRGGIIDIWSSMYNQPVRLEFWGDELVSLRTFDPRSQKSKKQLEELYLPPVTELLLTDAMRTQGAARLRQTAEEANALDRKILSLLEDVENGLDSTELDPYIPLFYPETSTVFDYLPKDAMLFVDGVVEVENQLERRWEEFTSAYEENREAGYFALPLDTFVLTPQKVQDRLELRSRLLSYHILPDTVKQEPLRLHAENHDGLRQEIAGFRGKEQALQPLLDRLVHWHEDRYKVFLVCHTPAAQQRMEDLLKPHGVRAYTWDEPFPRVWEKLHDFPDRGIHLVLGSVPRGQVITEAYCVFLTEDELFGKEKTRKRPRRKAEQEAFGTSFEELSEGDFIVHVEHGIGLYRGLIQLEAGGQTNDFLQIEYLGNDKLFLPVHSLDKIQKYRSADGVIPRLDRMGGTRWLSVTNRVKEAVAIMARELLDLYAKREATPGFAFSPPDNLYRDFEGTFPFEETIDQERAINDVVKDMARSRPMDRLVCGDVGFGKTEVAIRAAFKAAEDNKQVAVLVPTTILALQHYRTFRERFKDYPIRVDMVNRLRTSKQIKVTLEQLKDGRLDVIIGTHRLLSKDVNYNDLGLLIVDEEQRFGVAHKERIKKMVTKVDVLTLTATPIPRTLNMAFSGVRDLSVIQTPPTDRLAIRTFVCKFDEETIRKAIQTELRRGGQVYFVHNRVSSIFSMANLIKRLVPESQVTVGHGQMPEKQLEQVMVDFTEKKYNVLVATTIIESGLDIPSVNTLIVNRADTFGLSQLYQIRGRVGRGRERAYAYLMVPNTQVLTRDAQKRLNVLMRFTELGSGFKVASHDLEIRGAGNLLGNSQSGHIAAVGIDLYMELIEEAVAQLKGEARTVTVEPDIKIPRPAFLPEEYIPEAGQRLELYKRLSKARDNEEVEELLEEIGDRFGRLPDEVKTLGEVIHIKARLRGFNAAGLELTSLKISLNLGEHCTADPARLVAFVSRPGSSYQMTPEGKLIRSLRPHERKEPLKAVHAVLDELQHYLKRDEGNEESSSGTATPPRQQPQTPKVKRRWN